LTWKNPMTRHGSMAYFVICMKLAFEASRLPDFISKFLNERRRQQLCLQYICKLRSNPCNPAFNNVFSTGVRRLFEARPNTLPTLGIRLNQLVIDSEIDLNSIAINTTPYIPPWVLKPPEFQLSLHLLGNKSEVSPTVYQSTFNELLSQ